MTASTAASLWGADHLARNGVELKRFRDLTLMDIGDRRLVIACDSNASIGDKPNDGLQRSPEYVGYSAAKVPMMEVLAAGADPILLIDNLCVEMNPTGRLILTGIKFLIAESGLDVAINGSDEANVPTTQTGLGVTVIGVADKSISPLGSSRAGDVILLAGLPYGGMSRPYSEWQPDVAKPWDIRVVRLISGVAEVLPVGSRGVLFEIHELARGAGLAVEVTDPVDVDLTTSAGASTCFLISCSRTAVERVRSAIALPVREVGMMTSG